MESQHSSASPRRRSAAGRSEVRRVARLHTHRDRLHQPRGPWLASSSARQTSGGVR